MATVYLFQNDLRINDNRLLTKACNHAIATHQQLYPVYIWDDDNPSHPKGAALAWLKQSLQKLAHDLDQLNINLLVLRGEFKNCINVITSELNVESLFIELPQTTARAQIIEILNTQARDQNFSIYQQSPFALNPKALLTKQGTPFRVFSHFYRAFLANFRAQKPLPVPALNEILAQTHRSHLKDAAEKSDAINVVSLADLLNHLTQWETKILRYWTPGEKAAHQRLSEFITQSLSNYSATRDFPAQNHVSLLSSSIHFGELSINTIWHNVSTTTPKEHHEGFLRQLVWREFNLYLTHHYTHIFERPFNGQFERFPWQNNSQQFHAWQQGKTGYPIVDAGMRQLWQSGTIHNRVRMIVASFLTKHLLIDWRYGEAWFFETLIDADKPNNCLNWQWVAGSGADAAPYFRIFNPTLQSQKFDANGEYIRKWVPELSTLSNQAIHNPLPIEREQLNYPQPIVEHADARARALAAYAQVKL